MYCSSCGAAVPRDLNYCKRCGAKLGVKGEGLAKSPEPASEESLVWAMVAIFVLGIGVSIGLMAVMKRVLDFKPDFILAIALLSIFMILTIEGVFIWLLFSRRRSAKETADISRLKEQVIKELYESQAQSLPDPAMSVTEHTTNTLDQAYSEPKSR